MATHLDKEEVRKLILEVMREELGYDKAKYLNIIDRLARLEEGQKMILEMMDKRSEDINKRFEDMYKYLDARFGDMNRRFEDINRRFGDMNRRFEDINRRFDDMNKRFGDMNRRFSMLTTFMGIGFSGLAILIALLKIFA